MKSTSIFSLALLCIFLFSQFYFVNEVKTPNSYFQLINEGNRNLYDGDLELALQKYLNAFKTENHHFLHDIKKAIIISEKLEKVDTKIALLQMIVEDKNIDSHTFLTHFKSFHFFNKHELQIISKFRNENQEKFKSLYAIYFEVQRIQLARSNSSFRNEAEALLDNISWDLYEKYRDSIHNKLALEFINFCEKFGPPSEGNIGQATFCTVENDEDLNSIAMIQNMLRTFWKTNQRERIDKVLKQETLKGDFHPAAYAFTSDFSFLGRDSYNENIEYLNTAVILMMDKYYIPFIFYSDSVMQAINDRRNHIGLDSFKYAQTQVMCTRLCQDSIQDYAIMEIQPYSAINEVGLGFAKFALEREGLDVDEQLRYHRINTAKIMKECSCDNLSY